MNSNTQNTFETFVSGMIAEYSDELDKKFVKDFMFSLESEEKFPIPAEKLLEWNVFNYKGAIKRKLEQLDYKEGIDFCASRQKSTGGRPSEKITLTVDCFKQVCMAASNKNGKKVRAYYLVLEKLFKKYTEEEFTRQIA